MDTLVRPLHYDPTDDATRRNPYPLYAALHEQDPVHWSEAMRAWVVTRYEDVSAVTTSPAISSDRLTPFYESLKDERRDILRGVMQYLSQWLVFKAAPEHTRLRKLLNSVITPGVVASMEPQIRSTVDHILGQVDPAAEIEFMKDVAVLLPAYVILDMLGVPRSDFGLLKVWSDDLRLFIGIARGEADRYRRARSGADHMAAYFRGLIGRRRTSPGTDVISSMVGAPDEQGGLTEDERVASCMLMLFGGHETTTNLLGNAVVALLDNPRPLEQLRGKPALIVRAVEEFLRYEGPSNSIAGVVAHEQVLGGKTLRGPKQLSVVLASAKQRLSRRRTWTMCM